MFLSFSFRNKIPEFIYLRFPPKHRLHREREMMVIRSYIVQMIRPIVVQAHRLNWIHWCLLVPLHDAICAQAFCLTIILLLAFYGNCNTAMLCEKLQRHTNIANVSTAMRFSIQTFFLLWSVLEVRAYATAIMAMCNRVSARSNRSIPMYAAYAYCIYISIVEERLVRTRTLLALSIRFAHAPSSVSS